MNGNWKKLLRSIALILTLVMVLSTLTLGLVGCAKTDDNGDDDDGKTEGGNGGNGGDEEEIVDTSKMTGKEHFQYVEGKALKEAVGALTQTYGMFTGNMNGGNPMSNGARMDMTLTMGDSFLEGVLQGMGGVGDIDMDLSWLNEINLSMDVAVDDTMERIDMMLGIAGTDVIAMSMIMDVIEGNLWLGLPDLNDGYLEFSMADLDVDMDEMEDAMAQVTQIMEALPSEEVIGRLLNKYIDIVLDNLGDVEKKTETLELEGLKQEVTALTVEIDYEDALRIVTAVLKEARDDEDIKEVLEGLAPIIAGNGADADGLWEAFQESVDELLEELEEAAEEPQEGAFVLTTYSDSKNQIVGRSLATPETEADQLYYMIVTEGDKFAMEANVADQFAITGNGTNKGDVLSGSFTLSAMGMDIMTIEVEDFDFSNADAGYGSGTLRLKPNMGEAPDGAVVAAMLSEIEMKFEIAPTSGMIQMNVIAAGETVIGLTIEITETKGGNVSAPNHTINPMDQEELMEWVMGMDFNALIRSLKQAGAPSEITDMLEMLVEQMENMPG